MSTDLPFGNADPSWYRKVLDTLARDYPEISTEVWGKTISANAEEQAAKILSDPLPCAREGCGQTAAAHIGFMLGHQYEEPQPERQGLERASGYPRAVDGPGCTPAAVCGAQAQDSDGTPLHCNKAPDHLTKSDPWHNMVSAAALAGRQAADRVLRDAGHVCDNNDDCEFHPYQGPAEVQPEPPADATAGERCQKCRRPFDQNDPSFEGLGRHRDSPFCNSCVSACHDTEIADHWCAVDQWRSGKDYS